MLLCPSQIHRGHLSLSLKLRVNFNGKLFIDTCWTNNMITKMPAQTLTFFLSKIHELVPVALPIYGSLKMTNMSGIIRKQSIIFFSRNITKLHCIRLSGSSSDKWCTKSLNLFCKWSFNYYLHGHCIIGSGINFGLGKEYYTI